VLNNPTWQAHSSPDGPKKGSATFYNMYVTDWLIKETTCFLTQTTNECRDA